jgi:hypothetical protein
MSLTDDLLKQPPYRTTRDRNKDLLRAAVGEAILHHCTHCEAFARWYRKRGGDPGAPIDDLARLPFLPVTVFKRLGLESVGSGQVVRMLKSSATSSQTPSSVALDAVTRGRQMRVLAALMGALIGPARRPFVVLDAAAPEGSGVELPARVAGMRGYLMMASETRYVLESGAQGPALNVDDLRGALADLVARREPICLLGYTHILYRNVVAPLLERGLRLELPPESFILHFGGWKRLERQAVGRARFNADVARVFSANPRHIRDIYGFTEQLGVVYPDDGRGVRLAPACAEVFVRDPFTLDPAPDGTPGLLQFITPLPHSYPGISILMDDIGRIVSRDQEVDGRYGTRFETLGRAKGAPIRGCGDTLPETACEGAPNRGCGDPQPETAYRAGV